MTEAPHQPLLQIPWIWPNSKHFKVMIRFEDQNMRAPQPLGDVVRHVADIRELRDFYTLTRHAERNRLRPVVRYAERKHLQIAKFKRNACLNRNDLGSAELELIDVNGRRRSGSQERVNGKILEEHLQAARMIAMLVRDEHRIDAVRILSDGFEPLRDFFPAQSGIDQHADTFAFNEGRISATAACEHRDRERH